MIIRWCCNANDVTHIGVETRGGDYTNALCNNGQQQKGRNMLTELHGIARHEVGI